MAQQNIYDNEIFFEGYRKIRKKEGNANDLFEIPALLSMMPDLKGKRVLDLGCGYGEHCKLFVARGAKRVLGIDISQKMLEIAELFSFSSAAHFSAYFKQHTGLTPRGYRSACRQGKTPPSYNNLMIL